MKNKFIAGVTIAALWAGSSNADTTELDLPDKFVDSNGVNISSGTLNVVFPLVTFGDGNRLKADYNLKFPQGNYLETAFDIVTRGQPPGGNEISAGWTPLGPAAYQSFGAMEIAMPDGRYFAAPAGGRFLTAVYSAYHTTPGRVMLGFYDAQGNRFEPLVASTSTTSTARVTFADGEIWTIRNQKHSIGGARLRNIASNRGYMIQYEYQLESSPTLQSQAVAWRTPLRISGGSLAHIYCNTTGVAVCATLAAAGNSATVATFSSGIDITHSSGFKKRIEFSVNGTLIKEMTVSSPGANSQYSVSSAFLNDGCFVDFVVTKFTRNGQSWNYGYEHEPCQEEMRTLVWSVTRTDPLGKPVRMSFDSAFTMPTTHVDENGNGTSILFGAIDGYTGITMPEGNGITHTRNNRNNLTAITETAKGGQTRTRWSATYDSVCANLVKCNRPNSETDGKGNTTSYTYDPVHGGILTKTGPVVGGVTPQTRYEYAQRYAWLKSSTGGYSQAASPIWVMVRERYCRTSSPSGASCAAGSSDEVITDYDYGLNAGPNNLLVRGVAVTAGGQTRRTCFGYDQMGRKISETRPGALAPACS